MNSELDPTELLREVANEPGVAGDPAVVPSLHSSTSPQPSDVSTSDGDDLSFAKVQTLMIDLPSADSESTDIDSPVDGFKYIQGIVQGQRAYIVTNLLGESEILFQPQMVWTIGRNREAALPLRDRAMSRRHAVLLYVPNIGFQLIDLNSMNGSFANGTRIQQRHLLKDGDRIRLGSINFMFFASQHYRTLDAIHPEVLARFNNTETQSADFIDYSALEDPEILFGRKTSDRRLTHQ